MDTSLLNSILSNAGEATVGDEVSLPGSDPVFPLHLPVGEAGASSIAAAAVAAARKDLTDRKVNVALPGGTLVIEWASNDHILMTGPAELEFEGALAADTLSRVPV